jgi:hypothetical protein
MIYFLIESEGIQEFGSWIGCILTINKLKAGIIEQHKIKFRKLPHMEFPLNIWLIWRTDWHWIAGYAFRI